MGEHLDGWGTCVGDALLCDNGMVRDDARYPAGYVCTGGKHVAFQEYVRCTSDAHRVVPPLELAKQQQMIDVATLRRIAGEFDALADQVVAHRGDVPAELADAPRTLRDDANTLRRIAADRANTLVVATTVTGAPVVATNVVFETGR